jgi:hypothetical protein
MKAALVLFALLFLPALAQATDITVSCTAPTKFTDSSTITGAVTFNFYGALQGQPKQLLTSVPLTSCTSVRKSVNPGTQCYEVTAIVAGAESDHSAESCKTIATPKPLPPDAPVVTLSTTSTIAYAIQPGNDRLAFLIVGSVPLGTPCVATEVANGFYVVPRAKVTFDGPAKPTAVLARCGTT